jgi:hypothetical protein
MAFWLSGLTDASCNGYGISAESVGAQIKLGVAVALNSRKTVQCAFGSVGELRKLASVTLLEGRTAPWNLGYDI